MSNLYRVKYQIGDLIATQDISTKAERINLAQLTAWEKEIAPDKRVLILSWYPASSPYYRRGEKDV